MNDHAAEPHAESHLPTYNRVILVLAAMTLAEFGIAAMVVPGQPEASSIPFALALILLVGLATWKAVLVARFFMHLKYDPKLLAFIVASPVVLGAPLVLIGIFDAANGPNF